MEAKLAPLLVLAVKSVSGMSLLDPKSCTVCDTNYMYHRAYSIKHRTHTMSDVLLSVKIT